MMSAAPMTLATDLDQLAIDTIRTLSIDAVQKANSGHPGAPMGAAPMSYTLWTRFLRHALNRLDWPDRDRVGDEGAIIRLDHFGASAPAGTIFERFGFTAERVTEIARRVVRDGLRGRIPTVDDGHKEAQRGTGD